MYEVRDIKNNVIISRSDSLTQACEDLELYMADHNIPLREWEA